ERVRRRRPRRAVSRRLVASGHVSEPGTGQAQGHGSAGQQRRSGAGLLVGSGDRKSTRLNSSHVSISYAVFCLKKKKKKTKQQQPHPTTRNPPPRTHTTYFSSHPR